MSNYIAGELGAKTGRVILGNLHNGKLTVSEVCRFQNLPIEQKGSIHWNIPELYKEILGGLRSVGAYEEPVDGVSCSSWGADYLLFASDGSLITPTYHHADARTKGGMKKALSQVPWETIYEE